MPKENPRKTRQSGRGFVTKQQTWHNAAITHKNVFLKVTNKSTAHDNV